MSYTVLAFSGVLCRVRIVAAASPTLRHPCFLELALSDKTPVQAVSGIPPCSRAWSGLSDRCFPEPLVN